MTNEGHQNDSDDDERNSSLWGGIEDGLGESSDTENEEAMETAFLDIVPNMSAKMNGVAKRFIDLLLNILKIKQGCIKFTDSLESGEE